MELCDCGTCNSTGYSSVRRCYQAGRCPTRNGCSTSSTRIVNEVQSKANRHPMLPGLDENPEFYQARVLISEMTFVAPEHRKEKIHKHGHMHIDDYRKRADRFNNELVIAGHLSTRYNHNQVKRFVQRALPGMLDGRLKLWI